jgi:hypothetical protein
MQKIYNRKGIFRWLKANGFKAQIVITARATLRAVPALGSLKDSGKLNTAGSTIILPAFRAMTAPWIGAQFSSDDLTLRTAAASAASVASISEAGEFIFAVEGESGAASSVLAASSDASYSAANPDDTNAATSAIMNAIDAIEQAAGGMHSSESILKNYSELAASELARETAMEAINNDALAIEQGVSADVLANSKLWPEGMPEWAQYAWVELKGKMLESNQGWEVWTSWYESRLLGERPNQALEIAHATIPDEIWEQDPQTVNAYINRLVATHNQSDVDSGRRDSGETASGLIPASKAATVEPIWEDGVLKIPEGAASADLDDSEFTAAFAGLRSELIQFAADLTSEANIDQRFVAFIQRVASRIPNAVPPQHELFRLGHDEEVFAGYATSVNEQWPDFLASRYRALSQQFNRTIRQAPLWREFKQNAAKQSLTSNQVAAAAPARVRDCQFIA